MRKFVVALVVLMAFAVGTADAQNIHGNVLTTKTATIDSRTGAVVPAVTRLHPVIGSVQRRGHFVNPFTHKARYSVTMYNPLLGSFGTQKVRR